jgi:hypothetical protein
VANVALKDESEEGGAIEDLPTNESTTNDSNPED